jgi:hypothetical protein
MSIVSIESLKTISLFTDKFTAKLKRENLKKKEKDFYIFPTANNKFKQTPIILKGERQH